MRCRSVRIPCLRALLIQKDTKPASEKGYNFVCLRALLIQKDTKQR